MMLAIFFNSNNQDFINKIYYFQLIKIMYFKSM